MVNIRTTTNTLVDCGVRWLVGWLIVPFLDDDGSWNMVDADADVVDVDDDVHDQ